MKVCWNLRNVYGVKLSMELVKSFHRLCFEKCYDVIYMVGKIDTKMFIYTVSNLRMKKVNKMQCFVNLAHTRIHKDYFHTVCRTELSSLNSAYERCFPKVQHENGVENTCSTRQ